MTRKWPDNFVVTAGMLAPPPIETIATRSAAWIPLRPMACSSALTTLPNESRIESSSSVRVSRISPCRPGNSSTNVVAVLDDSCSLALRHSARSLVNEPIAEVPDGSNGPVRGISDMT